MAYIKRVEVELRHDGHAAQQREQAAPEKQQANWRNEMAQIQIDKLINFIIIINSY